MKNSIIQILGLAFLALGARAEELRLVDQNGLIRALKIDAKVSPVEVTLVRDDVKTAPTPILLSRVDGINAPLVGELQQGTPESLSKPQLGVVFRDVPPGIWRLEVEPNSVLGVQILSAPTPKPASLVHSTK